MDHAFHPALAGRKSLIQKDRRQVPGVAGEAPGEPGRALCGLAIGVANIPFRISSFPVELPAP
jgi:hypothetical protein